MQMSKSPPLQEFSRMALGENFAVTGKQEMREHLRGVAGGFFLWTGVQKMFV